ncbi:U2 small nuclear ribonucleoprotein A' isoform X2 [Pelobates fuscus]|uniref:U2 small nuclear ribonucleoprotein A' isoform X2 n=1 Tax=Pelobates fuscus TaxID=191477 RepID=UPI002FE4CE32
MVKLTADLIEQAAQYTNAVRDRELDLRGYKIPVIENLGATLDQFDTIDFSDNEIRKLDGFPLLKRLKTMLLNNNRICRIGEGLEHVLPNLTELILTNNNIMELGDLDNLATIKNLTYLRFTPGAGLPTEKKKSGPSPGDVEAIKNAIANATTLAEVERLKGLLQSGQIPGKDRVPGTSEEADEEMEEDVTTNGS